MKLIEAVVCAVVAVYVLAVELGYIKAGEKRRAGVEAVDVCLSMV